MPTFTDGVVPLSAPIDGEAYMQILLDRQAAWVAVHLSDGLLRPQPLFRRRPGKQRRPTVRWQHD